MVAMRMCCGNTNGVIEVAVFVLGDVRVRSHSKILSNVILGMGHLK